MPSTYLPVAIKAARRAASVITRAALDMQNVRVENKSVNDFVTSADLAAEQEIIRVIQQAFPQHAILSEEAGQIGRSHSDFTWIIDPIDGTTNFIHGIPQYAVSIALRYKDDIVAAVVYDVAKNELFSAARGHGAFLDNRRIRVSACKDLNKALIGTGFPFRSEDDFEGYMDTFMRVTRRTAGVRRPGSAALDLAWVACGRYDGFWESGLKPWDIAAGALLVQEAGGLITDLKGGEDWLLSGQVCAGTPRVFGQLLPIVGNVGPIA